MSNPHTADLEARARYREEGRQLEQERIIKLLEELDDEEWMGINQNFIALIKGENQKDNETVVLLAEG